MTIYSGLSHEKMVIFHSYVKLSEGNQLNKCWTPGWSWLSEFLKKCQKQLSVYVFEKFGAYSLFFGHIALQGRPPISHSQSQESTRNIKETPKIRSRCYVPPKSHDLARISTYWDVFGAHIIFSGEWDGIIWTTCCFFSRGSPGLDFLLLCGLHPGWRIKRIKLWTGPVEQRVSSVYRIAKLNSQVATSFPII